MTFEPKKYIDYAIKKIIQGTHDCDVKKTMEAIASISQNSEAAFYEKEIDEEKMQEYKDIVDEQIYKFKDNCSCKMK